MNLTCLITYGMKVTPQTQAHVRAFSCAGKSYHYTLLPFFRGAMYIIATHSEHDTCMSIDNMKHNITCRMSL